MRSIAVKLTLLFLLVSLIGVVLVTFLLRQGVRSAFGQFIQKNDQRSVTRLLEQYYAEVGSWEGIGEALQPFAEASRGMMGQGRMMHGSEIDRLGQRLVLVGPDRIILYSNPTRPSGDKIDLQVLKRWTILKSGGETIGWINLSPVPGNFLPGTPEGVFQGSINRASFLSALVAAGLAVALGGLLAYTLTRSLRELKQGTEKIAQGQFGLQVPVRSQDELGELTVSFNQMSLDLGRASQLRRQMTADIAHDLRTPLTVISGFSEALSEGKVAGTAEVYDILYQESRRLNRLVEDLRTLSLAEAGELSLNRQPVHPGPFLERLAARYTLAFQQSGVVLRVEAGAELPSVFMDPDRMTQVFDNLLSNALRYTPAGGTVILSAAHSKGSTIFKVSDTGQGIAAEDLPHIFDRFYRADQARASSTESGLGLAIARSLVALHGGKIEVESTSGQGSVFRVSL